MLDLLETPIKVVHIFVCVLLMLVVLIQPGKSGGLGAALGGAGAQQLFGGRGAGNFLSRATWISAVVFFMTSISLAYIATSTGDSLQNAVAAEPEAPEAVAPEAEPKGDAPATGAVAAPSGGLPSDVAPKSAGSVAAPKALDIKAPATKPVSAAPKAAAPKAAAPKPKTVPATPVVPAQ